MLVAVLNGIAAAPFLIVVMISARNRPLMGENRNSGLAAVLDWVTVALMTAVAVAVLVSLTSTRRGVAAAGLTRRQAPAAGQAAMRRPTG